MAWGGYALHFPVLLSALLLGILLLLLGKSLGLTCLLYKATTCQPPVAFLSAWSARFRKGSSCLAWWLVHILYWPCCLVVWSWGWLLTGLDASEIKPLKFSILTADLLLLLKELPSLLFKAKLTECMGWLHPYTSFECSYSTVACQLEQ